jgi:hypothetical protein
MLPSPGGPRIGAHAWRAAGLAEVLEDAHDHGALGDEGDELHAAAATSAAQCGRVEPARLIK